MQSNQALKKLTDYAKFAWRIFLPLRQVTGGRQVKLCDLVTHDPYLLSALAVVLPIIRRYTNNQISLTFYSF